MTDRELIQTILIDGELVRYFKLCAMHQRDPLEPRWRGLNVVTATLMYQGPARKRLQNLEGLVEGFHNLGAARFQALLEEVPLPDPLPLGKGPVLVRLARAIDRADFGDLWTFLRNRGYQPQGVMLDAIMAAYRPPREELPPPPDSP